MPKHSQSPSHRRSPHTPRPGRHEGARRPHKQRHAPGTAGTAGTAAEAMRWNRAPGENPGTLTDEDYLSEGGPDAIDSATAEDPADLPAGRSGRLP